MLMVTSECIFRSPHNNYLFVKKNLKNAIRYANQKLLCAYFHMMRMVDCVTIFIETLRRGTRSSLENKFVELAPLKCYYT